MNGFLGFLLGSIVVIIIAVFMLDCTLYKIEGIDIALSGYLTFASITIGVFATCIPILATLITTPLVKNILKDKIFSKDLVISFILTAFSGLISIISTIIFQVLLKNPGTAHKVYQIVSNIWISLSAIYCISLIIFYAIIATMFFKSGQKTEKNTYKGVPKHKA